MSGRAKVIVWDDVDARREAGETWRQIAEHYGVSQSTVIRAYESEDDYEVSHTGRKPRGERLRDRELETANQALRDTSTPLGLSALLSDVVGALRERDVTRLELDLRTGEAKLTYATTKTVKIG